MTEEEAEILLDLEPEELAIQLILDIKVMLGPPIRQKYCSALGLVGKYTQGLPNNLAADKTRRDNVGRAVWEAWSWLEANTLVVWPDQQNGSNG